jgi:uncharacterized membrane protein
MPDVIGLPVSRRTWLLCVWSCGLLGVTLAGAVVTGNFSGLFLPWNLLLAWMPYILSRATVRLAERTRHGTGLLIGPMALWLLFLPNAPYIITDLVHVSRLSPLLLVPGTLLIIVHAAVAMLLGLFSIYDMHGVVRARLGARWGWAFAGTVILLASVGVWMGRFLRWNSWDVLRDPLGVVRTTLTGLLGSASALWFVFAMTAGMLTIYIAAVRVAQRSARRTALERVNQMGAD